MKPDIRIGGVSERDIDLLILEEAVANHAFRRWFLEQVLGHPVKNARLVRAGNSISQTTGESDLELTFHLAKGRILLVLVENKISASFQPRQAERYAQRARRYLEHKQCTFVRTVLMAPAKYLRSPRARGGFDVGLTYEQLGEWIEGQATLGGRRQYKSHLLQSAIDKAVHGYQPVEDAPVTNFWRLYWQLSQERTPELNLPEPKNKPSGSGFIIFHPDACPRNVRLVHKLPNGHVDLEFRKMGQKLDAMRQAFGKVLLPEMRIVRAYGSAAIRIKVPPVDAAAEFEKQSPAIDRGLRKVKSLWNWFEEHRDRCAAVRP